MIGHTSIPGVIAALISTFDAAVTRKVTDAEDGFNSTLSSVVIVGARMNDDGDEFVGEVNGEQHFLYLGGRTKEENLQVPVTIVEWSGDSKVANRRAGVLAAYGELVAAHRADVTLGGACLDSTLGSDFRVIYMHTDEGNAAILTFVVTTRTHLTPS